MLTLGHETTIQRLQQGTIGNSARTAALESQTPRCKARSTRTVRLLQSTILYNNKRINTIISEIV
jgi:hypothetical protein